MKTLLRCSFLTLLMAITPRLVAQADGNTDWPMYNGSLDGQRYSSLKQIDASNVDRLVPVWAFQTGLVNPSTSFESTPVVVNKTMYVTTGLNVIYAIDASTGDLKWRFDAHPKTGPDLLIRTKLCCGHNNRGVAYDDGIIYMGTLDGRLIAIHADTGMPLETFVGDKKTKAGEVALFDKNDRGYSTTAAPIVWKNMIFIGAAGSEFRTRGRFSAYDAKTGKLLWRWFTTPKPGEPGGDSWPDKRVSPFWKFWDHRKTYEIGGVAVWMNPTVDISNNQVIFGTGNPNPDFNGRNRAGDNLYSCSIVALDASTGKLNWYFQEVRHDLWDYDQSAAPVLFTTNISGRDVEAVGAAGKTGWFYILDRKTGDSLTGMNEVDVPQDPKLATARRQRVPTTGSFVQHTETMWSPPSLEGVHIGPGLSGGSEWSPISFNPDLRLAYVSAIEKQMQFCLAPGDLKNWLSHVPADVRDCRSVANLAEFLKLISPLDLEGVAVVSKYDPVPSGKFLAIDVNTNQVVWHHDVTPHPIGGTLATAGNLVFGGEANGYFDAMDARTGLLLWRFQTGSSINAAPMTYAVNGRQFIAIAAGGLAESSLPNHPETGESSDDWRNFRQGGTVFVFALPQARQGVQ